MNTVKIFEDVIYGDNTEYFETQRHKELDKLFVHCVECIASTVNEDLRKAIYALYEMAMSLSNSAYNCGVAKGIELAKHVQKILDNPLDIIEESDKQLRSAYEAESSAINLIQEYLTNARKGA